MKMNNKCTMLALDTSTTKTGVSIWIDGKLDDYLLIDCSKNKVMDNRFKDMSFRIIDVLGNYKPDVIYIEDTVVVRNAQVQRFLTRLQGVIYYYCLENNCEFNTIRPTEWRKLLGFKQGKGTKREDLKKQSIQYVEEKYNVIVGDDEADAICIGTAIINKFNKLTEG